MRKAHTSFLLSLLIIGGLVSLVSIGLSPIMPAGGKSIPNRGPDESNRVQHSSGLSVVKPEGWLHLTADTDERYGRNAPAVAINCFQREAARFCSTMSVVLSTDDPRTVKNFPTSTEVKGVSAWQYSYYSTNVENRAPPAYYYGVCWPSHDRWLVVELTIYKDIDSLPLEFFAYLQTAAYHPPGQPVVEGHASTAHRQ